MIACWRNVPATPSISPESENAVSSSSSRPASIFEKSSTSSMMRSSACADSRMVATVRRCGAVEALALQHLDHAEHAVHRRADLVAHGGEEGRLRLVGGFRLGAFLLGGVARALGGLLRGGERLLAALERRDVAVEAEQAAVAQGAEIEFDVFAGRGAAARSGCRRAAGCAASPR